MQYKPEAEKVAIICSPYMPVPKKLSLTEDPQVQRTRKIFMIMLGVCLGLAVLSLSGVIFKSIIEIHNDNINPRRGTQAGQALGSILYYVFGLFVAYRYSKLGLCIFAWLGVIALIIAGIGIGILLLLLLFTVGSLTAVNSVNSRQVDLAVITASVGIFIYIFVIICVIASILSVIIIILAFKLARLIDANKSLVVQQI